MERVLQLALVRGLATPAEQKKWQQALESLQSPRLDGVSPQPSSIFVEIVQRGWLPGPSDIPALDAGRAARLCRAIDVDERAKALFRMLRARCRHSSVTPGKAVVTHPRVARGPNSRSSVQTSDSPAGLVRT